MAVGERPKPVDTLSIYKNPHRWNCLDFVTFGFLGGGLGFLLSEIVTSYAQALNYTELSALIHQAQFPITVFCSWIFPTLISFLPQTIKLGKKNS